MKEREDNKLFVPIFKFLNKNVNEFNKFYLSLFCILFLVGVAIFSYKISGGSYAIFSNIIEGKQKLSLTVVSHPSLDESGANAPVLSSNMIPVYFNESDSTWRKADSENLDKKYKWYDYNKKMWANSVTVSSVRRSVYLNAALGTIIPMDDILTMQVWIPRYKYQVFNYNENGETYKNPQQIDVIFERGKSSTGEIRCNDNVQGTSDGTKNGTNPTSSETCVLKSTSTVCTDALCNGKTYTHPAFIFGEEDVEGIWVGKFELTGTISNITTKPDVQSLRSQKIGSFATNIMNMKNANNLYGFSTSDDTHMIKNSEWGAVLYLAHSKYGMCTSEICKLPNTNNSSGYYTGRSGGNVAGSTAVNTVYPDQASTAQYNNYGFYTYDGYLLNYGTNTKSSTRDLTKIATITGNVYGIYDISGGLSEYVMANIVSYDGRTMMSGSGATSNSGYTGTVYESGAYNAYTGTYNYPNSKYYDKYSFNTNNTNKRLAKLGDAIKEVAYLQNNSWYADFSNFLCSNSPWLERGSSYSGSILFYSYNGSGIAYGNVTTRFVVVSSSS